MKRIYRSTLLLTVLVVWLASFLTFAPQQASAQGDILDLKAEAAILLDAKTGKILYEKNADILLGVASMSKMMTEYLVLEAVSKGKIKWDQKVTINEYIHNLSKAPGLSNIGLTQGESYSVKELYQGMAVHSDNAATTALAELISGSEKNFVVLMNKKAGELGLEKYKFVNSSGLNNSDLLGRVPAGAPDEENVMSARTTALLAYRLINDFPEVLDTAKISKLTFRDRENPYPNFNWMLPGLIYEYSGVDGLKTGSTDFAGYCFTSTAMRDGQRFISVVMKAGSKDERFTETAKVLDYAFSNFSKEEIIPKNYQVKKTKTIPVTKGKENEVKIHTNKNIEIVVKNGEKEQYTPVLVLDKKKLNKEGELVAPVKKGEKVGYLTIKPKNTEAYGFITDKGDKQVQVDVVAAESVEKANWFVLMIRGIGGFFGDIWGGVSSTVKGWF